MNERPATLTRDGKPLETRGAQFRAQTFNADTRTVTVSLGTGAPVLRYDYNTGKTYTEVLSMDPAHIRLDRMNGGAPFLEDHNQWNVKSVVGRFVKGTMRVQDGELVGDVRLSKAARHADTTGDIADGILVDTSAGYFIHAVEVTRDEQTGAETRTAIDWEPIEGSVVPVPADPTGGIRSAEQTPQVIPDAVVAPAERSDAGNTQEDKMDEIKIAEARAEGARAELTRQTEIRGLAAKVGLTDKDISAALAGPAVTVDAARAAILDAVAERAKATEIRPAVEVTRDEGATLYRGIEAAVEFKGGVVRELAPVAADLRGVRIPDLARRFLHSRGVNVAGRQDREVIEMAMRSPAGHTTGDFTSVFANVGNKALQGAYNLSSDYTWWKDLGTRADFPNMHPRYVVSLSGVGVLPTVTEGSDYEGVTQYDAHEVITPIKKGGEFRMTFEMAVQDDLSAFVRQALEFGKACQVTEHTMALAAMTANMVDGYAVCSSQHSNIVTSGGAPSTARIGAIDALLRAQTDGNGHVIGSGAKVGLFPIAQRATVEQIYSDRFATDTLANIITVPLAPENRRYVPGMSTIWFLATGNRLAMEYGWLQGEGGPTVSQYAVPKSDSVVFHCRDVFGVGVVSYRDFACDDGAT